MNERAPLNPITINATDFGDAWFQVVYAIVHQGREFVIDQGSYAGETRLELDHLTLHITEPGKRDKDGWPIIPTVPADIPPPVTQDYIADYARYIMTPAKEHEEAYTYGQRLWDAAPAAWCDFQHSLNQVSSVIMGYQTKGHRNNQMVLQVAQPSDLRLSDPPCLREIDTRIQDGRLHFFPRFRSWDCWGGLPANLAGLSILQEYMAGEIGVEVGEMICSTKGAHIYGYAVPLARLRCGK